MSIWLLYLLLLRATLTSFSGFASIPVVRDDLVLRRAVLSDAELNAAIAISQTSPGPLGLYLVVVGYFVAGGPGAAAAIAALATPALLAIPLLRAAQRGKKRTVEGASAGIVIASSALMLVAGARLGSSAAPSPAMVAIVVVGFIGLASGRVSPIVTVLAASLLVALPTVWR